MYSLNSRLDAARAILIGSGTDKVVGTTSYVKRPVYSHLAWSHVDNDIDIFCILLAITFFRNNFFKLFISLEQFSIKMSSIEVRKKAMHYYVTLIAKKSNQETITFKSEVQSISRVGIRVSFLSRGTSRNSSKGLEKTFHKGSCDHQLYSLGSVTSSKPSQKSIKAKELLGGGGQCSHAWPPTSAAYNDTLSH